ncbi:biopolymer transporter ExbB [Actibacterium sp. XHP0104]|uniref:biopolymer transporter ExbB n=1 Tax=Actibacterium sp. XHP0104 TaxID=2984335 RepID=UPI0021E7B531|nr:biopolymer transporter ExbB [Actibacterium sp. XHP0104]MCV2882278.1 biopolymer transporter ExbB [Actibacterium sp. XHP0104]
MDMTEREAEPHFSQPVRQILMMLVVVGLFSFGAYVAYPRVAPVFLANPYLNGVILLVFAIGVLACFLQVVQLISSVNWIVGFARDKGGPAPQGAPRLLAPLAALLRARGARMQIGATSARSILDSVATRIEEARDITRYIVNLLIFLGLLGTFYGLATTVPAVVDTIRSLAPSDGEGGVEVFDRLMTGLEAQLGGMGTAFSSSLLGLAGSLVVGLLELFASHGQNRFYRELEEWLSTITRLGFGAGDGDGGETGVLAGVLDQMAALLEASERRATLAEERLADVAAALEQVGRDDGTRAALTRIAEGQDKMITLLADRPEEGIFADAESRMRLRSMDVQLLRILEEIAAGRQETLADLRTDLAELTHVLRVAAGQDEDS